MSDVIAVAKYVIANRTAFHTNMIADDLRNQARISGKG